MWQTLANRKLKLPDGARTVLDHQLRTSEDVLTGMVFGRLAYLPTDLAWELVVGSAHGEAPSGPMCFEQQLWPRFRAPADVDQTHVEPDVLWVADDRVVVIEVKWHDSQKVEQLERERRTVAHAFERPVTVVALGSISPTVRQELHAQMPGLLTLAWRELRQAVDTRSDDPALAPEHRRVLTDVHTILESRGLRRAQYLAQLPSQPLEDSLLAMRSWKTT